VRKGFPSTIIRYITGQVIKTFLLTVSIVTVLWVFVAALQLMRHHHVGPVQFLVAVPLLAVASLAYTLPLGVLFSVSVAYGRMSAENEISAMAWNGVHLGWAMTPALGVALAATAASLYLNTEVVPAAMRARDAVVSVGLMDAVDRNLLYAAQSQEPIKLGHGRVSMSLDSYDPERREMGGVTIIVADEDWRPTRRIDPDSARLVEGKEPGALEFKRYEELPESERHYITIVFGGGEVTEFDPASGMAIKTRALVPSIAVDLARTAEEIDVDNLSLSALVELAGSPGEESRRNEARTVLCERVALGLSPFFFGLMAAPMAMVVRWKHTLTSFLPSLMVAVLVYYPAIMWARVQGEEGTLDPFYTMAAGNGVVLLVGLVLTVVVLRK